MSLKNSFSTLYNAFGSVMTYTWHYSTSSVLIIFSFSLSSKISSVLYIQFFWFQNHFLFYLIFTYFIVGYLYIYLFNVVEYDFRKYLPKES